MAKIKHDLPAHNVSFETEGFEGSVDVDDLTSIHYGNIEGEALTITTSVNKMGFLKSLAEQAAKKSKLDVAIYSAQFTKDIRKEASLNQNHFTIGTDRIKLTENSIKEALTLDDTFQRKSRQLIDDETNFELTSILYWSLAEKSKKLDKFIHQVKEKD